MKREIVFIGLALFSRVSLAQLGGEWSYHYPDGPSQWGKISGFELCNAGARQSPIAISSENGIGIPNVSPGTVVSSLRLQWLRSALKSLNNGHTIQFNYDVGSTLEYRSQIFSLKQFHFHSPAEHLVDGRQYPLEMHFVNVAADGSLAVIAVFFEEGLENQELARLWANSPLTPGGSKVTSESVDALDFISSMSNFFTYEGSLTTPPCTEGVRWIVMKTSLSASRDQLQFLQKTLGFSNNRPYQAIEGRSILEEKPF